MTNSNEESKSSSSQDTTPEQQEQEQVATKLPPSTTSTLSESEKQVFAAIGAADLDRVRSLMILHDVRTNCEDEHGMTLICHAAYRGLHDIVQLLIHRGADFNSRSHDSGYTPLMFAAMSGNVKIVRLLLDAGADVSRVNKVGRTAGQLCSFLGQHEVGILISNYVPRRALDYYTIARGLEAAPKLNPRLATPLHDFFCQTNLNPLWLAKNLIAVQTARVLFDNLDEVTKVIELMVKRECESPEINETRALKLHYLGHVLTHVAKETKIASAVASCPNPCPVMAMKNTDDQYGKKLSNYWMSLLVRPDKLDQFARTVLVDFPYRDVALLRQLFMTINPPREMAKTAQPLAPYFALISALSGRFYSDNVDDACGACNTIKAPKQCSKCKIAAYCNAECQEIHWIVHRRICKKAVLKASKKKSKSKAIEPEPKALSDESSEVDDPASCPKNNAESSNSSCEQKETETPTCIQSQE